MKTILLLAGLSIIAALALSLASVPTDPRRTGTADERSYWTERIMAIGAKRAYGEFKARYRESDFQAQHNRSHLFGQLLYQAGGMDTIALCDPAFGDFGCQHGLVNAAIVERGMDAIVAVNDACIRTLKINQLIISCQHGIGHGILEYLGRNRLLNALEVCPIPAGNDQLSGCAIGVFMEYNVPSPLVVSAAGSHIRTFDPAKPDHPCPTLPERFRQPCYHQLPQWWEKIMAKDYKKIGLLCNATARASERDACFRGVGNVAGPSSRYNVTQTIQKCDVMPSVRGRALCLQTASWGSASVPDYQHHAPELCRAIADTKPWDCAMAAPEINS